MRRVIPTDPAEYSKVVQQVSLRMQASADWYSGKRERMRRCYERWHRYPARPETFDDSTDYEVKLGYAFGIVEQINAKITEPLMNMGIPFGVYPTQLGDQAAADNFADVCRDFYSKPHVQMGKRRSKKEKDIVGTRVEIDEWLHVVEPGMRWAKVPIVEEVVGPDGKVVKDANGEPLKVALPMTKEVEVPAQITTHYGFNTRYPSIFDVYFEPNRTTIDTGQKTDIAWLIEDLGEIALEDMAREMIYNPETGKTEHRYDFTKLLEDATDSRAKERYANILKGAEGGLIPDSYGQLIVPVHDWTDARDPRDNTSRRKPNNVVDGQSFEDRDKIWVVRMRCKNEIVTIAQGKYIIERILDPWHRPRIGARVEVYTVDPRSIYGLGPLDPILDELDELDITHSLGMQNLWRLINKMIAVREKALVTLDDLDPRGGGIVRVNDEVNAASDAVFPIPTQNAIPEMLAGESDARGMIEFISSLMDGSPGVMGTKQNHKTAKGIQEIQANLSTRFATMQAYALINEALAGESMSYMFAQFAFEPQSYRRLRDDGETVYAQFTKDDIDTQGRGFRFLITVDPLWGNTTAQRQEAQEVFRLSMDYYKIAKEIGDPRMKVPDLSSLFDKVLKNHGYRDTSRIFYLPSGERTPEQELQILMQGGVVDRCIGDGEHHITTHLLQAQSPKLDEAIAAKKADPQTKTNLMRLVQQKVAEMKTFLQNPQAAAAEKLNQAGMKHPGGPIPS